MKEETLNYAKSLQDYIRDIRVAMEEKSHARHFAMLENYGISSATHDLPKWLTPKIMDVLGQERERLEMELENLNDDNCAEGIKYFPTGKYCSQEEQPKKKKGFGFWKTLFVILFCLISAVSVIEFRAIRNYQESEKEWVRLSEVWREKLDTCVNRNERIYQQLNQFKDIRIQQLKEEKGK